MENVVYTDSGLPVYSYTNLHLHSFYLSIYVKAGCMYEDAAHNGITHFIEHLVFRNINRAYQGELYKILDMYALNFNAATYKEFVQFSISGAPCHYMTAVQILAKVFMPLELPAGEINVERSRIKSEIREGNERTSLDYFTQQYVWADTGLAQTITGSASNLDKMKKSDLIEYQKEMFSVNNVFCYITGCVDSEQINRLKSEIEKYGLKKSAVTRDNVAPVPKQMFRRGALTAVRNGDSHRVRFSFDVDSSKYPDAALQLSFDIMFGQENESEIFRQLSEKKGYIYSYDSTYEQYKNVSNMYFSYEIQPAHLLESVRIVCDILQASKKCAGSSLKYVKASYIDNAYILIDYNDDFNWNRAYEGHLLDIGYRDINDRIKAYEAVMPEIIENIAKEVFVPDNIILTVKGDKKKIPI